MTRYHILTSGPARDGGLEVLTLSAETEDAALSAATAILGDDHMVIAAQTTGPGPAPATDRRKAILLQVLAGAGRLDMLQVQCATCIAEEAARRLGHGLSGFTFESGRSLWPRDAMLHDDLVSLTSSGDVVLTLQQTSRAGSPTHDYALSPNGRARANGAIDELGSPLVAAIRGAVRTLMRSDAFPTYVGIANACARRMARQSATKAA